MAIKRSLEVQCFKCQKKFLVKWVIGHNDYSKKNDWEYWTEKKENKGKQICNECLLNLYNNRKYDYYELVSSKRKVTFRVYLANGKFS